MAKVYVRGNTNNWIDICNCKFRKKDGTWMLYPVKDGDRVRGNTGNWITITCPVSTFTINLTETGSPSYVDINTNVIDVNVDVIEAYDNGSKSNTITKGRPFRIISLSMAAPDIPQNAMIRQKVESNGQVLYDKSIPSVIFNANDPSTYLVFDGIATEDNYIITSIGYNAS